MQVYRKQGRLLASLELQSNALRIRECALGASHPACAEGLDNLGCTHRQLGNADHAYRLHARAAAIWTQSLGHGHFALGSALENMAKIELSRNNITHATTLYQTSLQLRLPSLGASHPDCAVTWSGIARASALAGEPARAVIWHLRALRICEETVGAAHLSTSYVLADAARTLMQLSRFGSAAQLCKRVLAIRRVQLPADNVDVVSARLTLYSARWIRRCSSNRSLRHLTSGTRPTTASIRKLSGRSHANCGQHTPLDGEIASWPHIICDWAARPLRVGRPCVKSWTRWISRAAA